MKNKILLLTIITLLSGCKINDAIRSVNSAVNQISPSVDSTVTKATYSEVCKDFDDNDISAKQKWRGKWVIFEGKVNTITSLEEVVRYDLYKPTPPKVVAIKFNNKDGASYTLKPSEEKNVLNIKKGQTAKIKGEITDITDALGCLILLDNGTIQ
ncbi:hypothetical protein JC794_13700 [Morganella morganii]|uniref:OB-fold protein n=1 Tax=Morganella morganii TaxID=582 RepID=UPI000D1FB7E3|nr:hypothetical protein [Morganella morganii]HAE77168.1 hypothetical protein [Morganella sp. (in: enterobacteria)]QXO41668.1 hypothetical protein CXB74_013595 [Morganella morganii]QXO45302.1 hypothetical protein JC862_13070 [Morganella morganii]QXO48880.1 hypothetical protein JC861_13515 [Morganella morganii]QXO52743.1 hypothetical protein JC830_13510 [Morganella morganii]